MLHVAWCKCNSLGVFLLYRSECYIKADANAIVLFFAEWMDLSVTCSLV